MKHPVYNRAARKKKSNAPWIIMLILLLITLAVPWILPSNITEKEPFSTIKQITTFNLEYEWHHSTKNIRKSDEIIEMDESDGDSSNVAGDLSGGLKWFPLAVGNRWTYEHTKTGGMMNRGDDIVSTKVIEIVEKIEVRNITLYKVKSTENDKEQISYYFTESDGLKITHDSRHPTRKALLVMPMSPQIGDSWHESGMRGPLSTVIAFKTVKTANSSFNAMLVETQYLASEDRKYQTYYAQNIGIVMQTTGSDARGKDMWLLQDFTLN